MQNRQLAVGPARRHRAATVASDAKILAKQRLRGGCAERDEDFWPDCGKLGLEPRKAGGDFRRIGLAVDAPGAARHPFEMLHGVAEIDLATLDTGLDETAVEQSARRPDKRMPGLVLDIAGRFT